MAGAVIRIRVREGVIRIRVPEARVRPVIRVTAPHNQRLPFSYLPTGPRLSTFFRKCFPGGPDFLFFQGTYLVTKVRYPLPKKQDII